MFNRQDPDPMMQMMFDAAVLGMIGLGLLAVGWTVINSLDRVQHEWDCVTEAYTACVESGQDEAVCHDAAREICK